MDAITVLMAVMDSDDLMRIDDLSQINNKRIMVVSLEEFRRIMSKAAPVLEPGHHYEQFKNPFLSGQVPDGLKSD